MTLRGRIRSYLGGFRRGLISRDFCRLGDRRSRSVFARMNAGNRASGLLIIPDLLFTNCTEHIVELASRHKRPTVGTQRSFPRAGGHGLVDYARLRRRRLP
jgi:hypothetical protein